jgi:hypothetical protein
VEHVEVLMRNLGSSYEHNDKRNPSKRQDCERKVGTGLWILWRQTDWGNISECM